MNAGREILHPIAISQVMVNFAAGLGLDQETCLLGTGIESNLLEDPAALIRREQEMRLVENLMLGLPDVPALGFRLGLQYNVSTFGSWGFALRTCRTLRDSIKHAMRYLPLSTAYCRMNLLEAGEWVGVRMDADAIPQHLRQFLLERDMATALNLFRELSLAGLKEQQLLFECPTPDYADSIEQFGGIRPQFEREFNAMLMPRTAVDKPVPTFDAQLVRMLEDQCREQLLRRQQSGLTGQVRALLLGELGLVAGIEEVARALALSPRSLRRKLGSEGSNFSQILEAERRQLAEQLLASSRMTIDELAIHLGYAESGSFTRAFRRWTGMAPGEFRNRQRS